MRFLKKEIVWPVVFLALLAGCGSTVRGVKKDVTRVGKGIKTIFVSEDAEAEKKKSSFWDWLKGGA